MASIHGRFLRGSERLSTRFRACWLTHASLADEGNERMMRVAPFAVGVVALGRAFLAALASDDRAIKATVTAPTLICAKNHFCKAGNTAVLRALENLPKNRL